MAICEEIKGKDSSYVAEILNSGIGNIYEKQGKYPEALEAFERANKIYGKNEGVESEDYVLSLHNIGNLYYDMTDYDKSLEIHVKVLPIK